MNMLTLSLAFLLMCRVGEKHCCQVLKLILMQSTYFPNRFGRKSSTEGKQDFSIHGGSCVTLYVNNAVLRQARAIMRICEFKSQSATYVGAFSISQLELYSFLFHF